ncbi:MAG: hypothetical protein IT423_14135 [Pirellulaceae bacterium]|nr:hypothetical protein [Pirellulaceae bacterium]
MKRAVKNFRRPRLESLELRQLMAGDVAVALEGSLLRIEGDALDNQIVVAQSAAGDVVVSGQNGTLINGLPSVRFVRPALNAMEVRMEAGNDTVTMRSVQLANDLFVDLGAGNDRFVNPATGPMVIGANATIYGEAGSDVIQLNGTTVREDLYIDGGIGALNAQLTGVQVDKFMAIVGDEANDIIAVSSSSAGLGAAIETKGGSDRVTMTDVDLFALSINTDANSAIGADVVALTRVNTVEDLGIFTGDGNDIVRMTDANSGKSIIVSLDAGNDQLVATRVAAAEDAVFEGGAGVDTLTNLGIFGGIKREFKEFEVLR